MTHCQGKTKLPGKMPPGRSFRTFTCVSLLLGIVVIVSMISNHQKLLADFREITGKNKDASKAAHNIKNDGGQLIAGKRQQISKGVNHVNNNVGDRPMLRFKGLGRPTASDALLEANEKAANIIFFVWCGVNRLFEFRHMLSVLSAIKVQQPLQVTIYHPPGESPQQDLYNDWLTELKLTFHHFRLAPISFNISKTENCKDEQVLSELFSELPQGGIFMNENVILLQRMDDMRRNGVAVRQHDYTPSIVVAKQYPEADLPTEPLKSCIRREIMKDIPNAVCITLNKDVLHPVDIMTSNDRFAETARKLFYGSPEIIKPRFDLSTPIPNIGHLYVHNKVKFRFCTYLSIYSLISVMKVDMVYIHSSVKPYGSYWQRLVASKKVEHVFCPPIMSMFGNELTSLDTDLAITAMRVHLLYLYGGVLLRRGVIATQPLSKDHRGYDVIMGYGSKKPEEASTFPEMLSTGIIAAKPGSNFLSLWLKRYENILDMNDALVAYKLYERHPQAVKLDVNFQINCDGKGNPCQPPLKQNHPVKTFNLDTVNAVNLISSQPHEFLNEKRLRSAKTMVGRIGQKVMGWR